MNIFPIHSIFAIKKRRSKQGQSFLCQIELIMPLSGSTGMFYSQVFPLKCDSPFTSFQAKRTTPPRSWSRPFRGEPSASRSTSPLTPAKQVRFLTYLEISTCIEFSGKSILTFRKRYVFFLWVCFLPPLPGRIKIIRGCCRGRVLFYDINRLHHSVSDVLTLLVFCSHALQFFFAYPQMPDHAILSWLVPFLSYHLLPKKKIMRMWIEPW